MSVRKQKKSAESNWGARLSSALKERNVSYRQAAKIAGVSPSVIDSWSAGRSPQDFVALNALCKHLRVSFSWLLTGEHDQGEKEPSLSELFVEEEFFNGLARIRIDRLMPRKKKERL